MGRYVRIYVPLMSTARTTISHGRYTVDRVGIVVSEDRSSAVVVQTLTTGVTTVGHHVDFHLPIGDWQRIDVDVIAVVGVHPCTCWEVGLAVIFSTVLHGAIVPGLSTGCTNVARPEPSLSPARHCRSWPTVSNRKWPDSSQKLTNVGNAYFIVTGNDIDELALNSLTQSLMNGDVSVASLAVVFHLGICRRINSRLCIH